MKAPSVSKIFPGSDLSNMEEFVEKMMKGDGSLMEEERQFPENAINFEDFSKMISLPSDHRGSSIATMSPSSKNQAKSGTDEAKLHEDFQNEAQEELKLEETAMKQEGEEMLENFNRIQKVNSTHGRIQTTETKGKKNTNKQPPPKKMNLKTYSDLRAVLDLLEKFDWADESLNQPKILPSKSC